MNETAVARRKPSAIAPIEYTPERIKLLKQTVAVGLTDPQFALFLEVCQFRRLNPFAGQIYAVVRWSKAANAKVMTIQTGIDGFRLSAQRSGKYAGQTPPEWCGPDGKWREVWLEDGPPAAARVGIKRKGFDGPVWGVVRYSAYAQTKQDGSPNHMWTEKDAEMLAKCAEAQGLRKAFPEELSGLNVPEEFGPDEEPETVRGPHAIAAEATKTVEQAIEKATESGAEVVDAPPVEDGPPPMTLEMLSDLVKQAAKVFRGRTFLKAGPAEAGNTRYFVDRVVIERAGLAGSVLLWKDGETMVPSGILEQLFAALKAEIEDRMPA
jgi:phage recombination protein Bet